MQGNGHMSRRDFVKTSAAVAGGAVAVSQLASTALAASPRIIGADDQIKVGLVGCGGRGSGAALDAIFADKGVVLWAIADMFPDRLQRGLAGIKGELESRVQGGTADKAVMEQVQVDEARCFTGFDGYRKVIDSCDAVVLATPPHFRPQHLKAAIDAGRHVFCEKPVAVDAAGVRSVLETARAAKASNLTLVSGFCWRYSARERETFKQIHNGGVGDIRAIYTTYNTGGWVKPATRQPEWTEMENQLRSWHFYPWLSGDHIVEQACHSIDKMAWAMQDVPPLQCTAVGGRQCRDQVGEPGSVFDHFAVTYDYPGGVRGFHMCRHFPNSPFDNSDTILGSKGVCRIDGWAGVHEITGEKPWKCDTVKNDMYQQEHNEFFAAIRGGTPINDGERMATSTLLAIMARMAAYTAQTVTWEQAMNSQEELKPSAYQFGDAPSVNVPRPGLTKFS